MHRGLGIMSGCGPTAMLKATDALTVLPKWFLGRLDLRYMSPRIH